MLGMKTQAVKSFQVGRGAPRRAILAKATEQETSFGQKAVAAALAATLAAAPVSEALAGEFDILSEERPTSSYLIDDANIINKTTKKAVQDRLKRLEYETGYRVEAITVRKLEVEQDAFAFADRVLEGWYPTPEEGDKKGIVLIVSAGKDGAVTGGPAFMAALGDELIDSIISENVPILTGEEKYNECMTSILKRVDAKLNGEADPGPPVRQEADRRRTYKTKDEVDRTKGVSSTVVGTLLFISIVVPMLQYYGYTSKD